MQMNAKVQQVLLTVWVPYPANVQAEVDRVLARAATLQGARGFYVCCAIDDLPAVVEFMETLPADDLRAEFTRKAKKLGLGFKAESFGLPMFAKERGVSVEVWARA